MSLYNDISEEEKILTSFTTHTTSVGTGTLVTPDGTVGRIGATVGKADTTAEKVIEAKATMAAKEGILKSVRVCRDEV